jgi:hypothetical protein
MLGLLRITIQLAEQLDLGLAAVSQQIKILEEPRW